MGGAPKDGITIPYSRAKGIFMAVLCCAGIAFGILAAGLSAVMAAAFPNEILEAAKSNPMPVIILVMMVFFGVAFVILFAKTFIFVIQKIAGQEHAYVIDGKGIFIGTSMVFSGVIPWEDIRLIRTTRMNSRVLAIELNAPGEYIKREPVFFKRAAMKLCLSFAGSPVLITTNLAKISSGEMRELLSCREN